MDEDDPQGVLFPPRRPVVETSPTLPPPTARSSDPETSHRAADDASHTASFGRLLVLQTLARCGGLTDFELADKTGWQQTSIGKRRGECRDAGLVQATDQRRPTPSGSAAIVWELTAKGRDLAR